MVNLTFLPEAWEDYLYWQGQDKRTLKKINGLIKDIMRDYYHGLGKPEPLKGNLSGWWSRRIDKNRIQYSRILFFSIQASFGRHPGSFRFPA